MVAPALMRPDTLTKVRWATVFYLAVLFGSVVYAFLFGNLHLLLGEQGTSGAGLGRGLLLGLAIVLVSQIAHGLFRFAREATRVMAELIGPIGVGTATYLALLSGVAEELFFRGALWPHLGLAGTSILFGILHTVPLRALAFYPVFATLAGLVFGILRQETGSIWPPVVAHVSVNAINLSLLGLFERRRLARTPALPNPPALPRERSLEMPEDLGTEESFPLTIWRYDLRIELQGTDRQSLPECLEHEHLALFACVPRQEVYAQFSAGGFAFTHAFAGPFRAFPQDIAILSTYLFQPVFGIEVAERYTDPDSTDDVRAWKIVAQRGEWVKVPLLVEGLGQGRFRVDRERDDVEVLAAHWSEYPRWFQDGMRFKYPALRDL